MLRSWLPTRTRNGQPQAKRTRLAAEPLEDRTVLSSAQTLDGLRFVADGQFTTETVGSEVHVRADGPVEVGLDPAAGESFDPLLKLTGGVDLLAGDAAGRFSTDGAVVGVIGGHDIPLAPATHHELSAASLLGGGAGIGGQSLSVAGASFTLSDVELADGAVKLQGRIAVPQLAGLEVAVEGEDYVVIDRSGVHLTGLDASLTGSFDVLGLSVDVDHAGVEYHSADDTFGIFGGVYVSTPGKVFDHVGANLGSADDPGLVIADGRVAKLDVGVEGAVTLYGLTLSSKDLSFHYDAGSGVLRVAGGLGFDVGGMGSASATLTGDGMTIDTRTGAVAVSGVTLQGSADFGPIRVDGLTVEYQNTASGSVWAASGMVQLVPGLEVGGSFTIADGKLTEVGIAYDAGSGTGLPIGDTGLYLTHAGGKVDHLDDPADVAVSLEDVTVVFGKQVSFMGKDYAAFSAAGTLTVDRDKLVLDGDIQLVGGLLGSGTATVTLDWAADRYTVDYDTRMYDGVFHQTGELVLDGAHALSLDATADLEAPAQIRNELKQFGLPTSFAGAAFRLRIDADKPAAENYVEASFDAVGLTATVRYDFTNALSLTVRSGALEKLSKVIDAAGKAVTDTFDAAGNLAKQVTKEVGKTVTETYDAAGDVAKRVTQEAGETVTETYSAAGELARRVTQEAGETVTETFNAAGKLTQRVTKDVGATITESFDVSGMVSRRVTETAGRIVTDAFVVGHRVTNQVEQMVTMYVGGYPVLFRSVATKTFNLFGRVSQTVTRTFDRAGDLVETVTETAGRRVTEYAHETITETLNAAGYVTRRVTDTLDDAGRVTKQVVETFDNLGRKIGNALNPLNW